MAETTQINKFKQKRLRSIASKTHTKDDKPINSYFYPKNNLYTRQEFELLDTIYSDEPPTTAGVRQDPIVQENFWPQNKEDYIANLNPKNNLFTKVGWFLGGVILTSMVWLIYFQLSVYNLKTKHDTQIVFQKTASLVTDKTIDEEVTKKLESKQPPKFNFSNWFVHKPKEAQAKDITLSSIKYHTVTSGDSLWIIANKYYLDPSPSNIEKIMKANNMKRVGFLNVGQKLVIP